MAALLPISLASIVTGFISFGLTILIWLNNFWFAFQTIGSAPTQVQDSLSTLRQALYEEREHLKSLRERRRSRKSYASRNHAPELYLDSGPLKVVNDAVKDLIRDFKKLEDPFLIPLRDEIEKELEWSFGATQQYYKCDLPHRILWLRAKGGVADIAAKLEHLQTRRIVAEVTKCHGMLVDIERMAREHGDRLLAIEDRLRMSHIGQER